MHSKRCLIIDQGDVQLVRVGQAVDMKLDSRRLETFSGMITEKSNEPLECGFDVDVQPNRRRPANRDRSQPQDRSNLGTFPTKRASQYEVDDVPIRPGYRGSAKIHVDPMSLGSRLWRVIAKTFNFEL